MKTKLEIGQPLHIEVVWYDQVPEPARKTIYDGEVIGWRAAQVIVRIRDYAVCRFWKKTGLEVGNPDHVRRGFRVDLSKLDGNNSGVDIPIATDTDA
jgi:hypothetical protein